MEQELRRRLIAVADAYQAGTGALSERTIGNRQLKNEGFIQGVRSAERGFNIRKYDQLMHWYADNWPDDSAWPSNVPHPSHSNFDQLTPAVAAADPVVSPAPSVLSEVTHG